MTMSLERCNAKSHTFPKAPRPHPRSFLPEQLGPSGAACIPGAAGVSRDPEARVAELGPAPAGSWEGREEGPGAPHRAAHLPGCCSSRSRWLPRSCSAPPRGGQGWGPRRERPLASPAPVPRGPAATPSAPATPGGIYRWLRGISCPCSTATLGS